MKVTAVEYYLVMAATFVMGFFASWGVFYREGLLERYCASETTADWAAAIATFMAVLVAIFEGSRRSREERVAKRQRAAMLALAFDRELFSTGVTMLQIGNMARSALASYSVKERSEILQSIMEGLRRIRFPLLSRFADALTDFDAATSAKLILVLGQFLAITEREPPDPEEMIKAQYTGDKNMLEGLRNEADTTLGLIKGAQQAIRDYIRDVARIKVEVSIEEALERAFPE